MNVTVILFWFLSVLALFSALMMIFSRNPVHSVLWLIVTFFSISGHYILLNAQFLAIVNIIVYAGAIMAVSYTHLRAHETPEHLVCRLLLEKKKKKNRYRLLLTPLPT